MNNRSRSPRTSWVIRLIIAIPAVVGATNSAQARTWHVRPDGSGDAPTIQAGIDSATTGDGIIVSPGTYYEVLDAGSKQITLQGSQRPEITIVDAGRRNRVLRITAGLVEGFTFRNGLVATLGGGVLIEPPGPTTFRNNIVEDNVAGIDFDSGGGGGVAIRDDGALAVHLSDNVIRNNSAGESGGGLVAQGGVVQGNLIYGNTTKNAGGGVLMGGTTFVGNLVFDNEVAYIGAGISVFAGGGGEIRNNTIIGNTTTSSGLEHGGGIDAGSSFAVSISHNLVVGNHSLFGHGAAGIRCNGREPFPECNDIWQNDSDVVVNCERPGSSNFSADPQFCAVDPISSQRFGLQSDSPCAPGQDPSEICGLVGAATVACETVSVARKSWTAVKRLYR